MKPTWLLITRWIVPPVLYPRREAMFKVSGTTPWPANAASPWIRTGTTGNSLLEIVFRRSSFARTIPSRTGLTASKCDGFAARETLTLLPSRLSNTPSVPR